MQPFFERFRLSNSKNRQMCILFALIQATGNSWRWSLERATASWAIQQYGYGTNFWFLETESLMNEESLCSYLLVICFLCAHHDLSLFLPSMLVLASDFIMDWDSSYTFTGFWEKKSERKLTSCWRRRIHKLISRKWKVTWKVIGQSATTLQKLDLCMGSFSFRTMENLTPLRCIVYLSFLLCAASLYIGNMQFFRLPPPPFGFVKKSKLKHLKKLALLEKFIIVFSFNWKVGTMCVNTYTLSISVWRFFTICRRTSGPTQHPTKGRSTAEEVSI